MVSSKVIAIHPLVFVYQKSQYVNYSKNPEKNNQERYIKRTYSLFMDDLKVCQESHQTLKDVNETIVQASNESGACYGVVKYAEVVIERGKIVKGADLQVLTERMKTIDTDENEIYKFLKEADGIRKKKETE